MLVGGIPPYLRLASRYESVEEFLREEFLSDYGFFYDEPYVLLSEELRELKGYFSILRAIAEGNTRLERISNYVGIPMKSVYPYVENLLRLGLIEREKPLLGDRKVSLYRIRDPMLLTWFTLTYPQLEAIATGTAALDDLYRVLSRRFEDLAREFLVITRPFEFERLGRWWFRGEEIDVVAVKRDTAHLIEVKWEELGERDARRIIGDLERKSRMVRFNGEFHLGIIARRIEGKDELREEGFLAFDLENF